jgi:hypothetical protein
VVLPADNRLGAVHPTKGLLTAIETVRTNRRSYARSKPKSTETAKIGFGVE